MYDRAFNTDWESLSGAEATKRMYALGIAAKLGNGNPTERARIRELAASAYERGVLELAYDEGKREVADARPHHDSDEAAWEALVEAAEPPSPESLPTEDVDSRRPRAVERPSLLGGFDAGDLDRLRPPSFLDHDQE